MYVPQKPSETCHQTRRREAILGHPVPSYNQVAVPKHAAYNVSYLNKCWGD